MTVRLILSAIVLFLLWLLMSGLYKPLIIGFGVLSVALAVFFNRRMDAVDGDRIELNLGVIATIKYWCWLMVEIAKSNWAVTKIILSAKMPISQHMFKIPHSQKTDLGQVIYANSITLTPGTITVETEETQFLVHALSYSPDDIDALADMDSRVTAIEAGESK